MSFSDRVYVYLLPQSSSILQRPLSTSSMRPKSYPNPPLSRHDFVTRKRNSISKRHSSISLPQPHASLDQTDPTPKTPEISNDDASPPIPSPPPFYDHNYSEEHPPPAYRNSTASTPHRTASSSTPLSSTDHRNSSTPLPSESQTPPKYKQTISPIPQSSSHADPPDYVFPILQEVPNYTSSNNNNKPSSPCLNEEVETITADSTLSTAISTTRSATVIQESPPPPSFLSPKISMANSPRRPKLTLRIPQEAAWRLSDGTFEDKEDWGSEYNLMQQMARVVEERVEEKEKEKEIVVRGRGNKRGRGCCGFFGGGLVDDEREQVREFDGGMEYLRSFIF